MTDAATARPWLLIGTRETKAEAYMLLREKRSVWPRRRFDLLEVRFADPPIRTTNPWAVVEYV